MPLLDPVELPESIAKMIDEYLGQRALDIQKGTTLGVWIVGHNQENNAKYVPVNIFLRDMIKWADKDEMAYFAKEMSELDPSKELMIMFLIDENEQGLVRYEVKK